MPNLADLSVNHARMTRPTRKPDEPLIVDYRPGAVTPRQVHRFNHLRSVDTEALSDDERMAITDEQMRILAGMLIDWNLTGLDGEPIPATLEGLQDVDYATQTYLLTELFEEQQLGKSTATGRSPESSTRISTSGAAEKMTRTYRRSRTGTPTAARQNGSE